MQVMETWTIGQYLGFLYGETRDEYLTCDHLDERIRLHTFLCAHLFDDTFREML